MNNNFMQTSNLLQRKTKEYKFSGAFKQLFLIFIILIPSAMYSGTSVHGYVVNAESYYLSANDIYVIPESARPVVIHGWGTDKYYNGRQWIPTDGHGELYINGYCVVSDTKEFTYNLNANIGQVYNIKYVCFWYGSGKDLGATFRIIVVSEDGAKETNTTTQLGLFVENPVHWEKSYDNGATWEVVENSASCQYVDSSDIEQTVLYRVLDASGEYSNILTVEYMDVVPSEVKTLVDNKTKTVDESATFTLDIAEDDSYSYQWKHNGTVIAGATESTYTIPEIKSKDAGEYTCTVKNAVSESTSVGVTLSVNKCPQEIIFPEFEVKTYGDAPITLPEKTNKEQTITYQSTNQNVATISGNVLTIKAPGETNIIASQSGSSDYLAAQTITRKLTVNKIKQNIIFDAIPVKTYGNVPFTLPKTSDKGLPLTYTIVNTEVATLGSDGYTVTIQNAGATDIVASQPGDATHYAADPVTQTLTVNKATQSISFAPFDAKQYGDPAITLNAVTDRNLTIKYTANNDVVSINGNVVTINKVGTATITATQEGNKNYLPADPVTQNLIVSKANQIISFGAIENRPYGSPDFTLPSTTNQGLTITYTCDNATVAEVEGNTVKVKNAGTCNITASQDGTDNYEAAASVTQSFTVTKAYQEITFAELPAYTYGCAPVSLMASSNMGGEVYFESSDQSVATITGSAMTIAGAGKCYITAKSNGNGNLYDATPVQRQLVVNKASQTVSLDDLEDRTYGDAGIQLSAIASTGMVITYTSSNPSVLEISGSTAIIKGAGDVTITATQKGNNDYESVSVSTKLHINKANLVVKADNKTKLYGDNNPELTVSYNGLVNGDTPSCLKQQPKATTTVTALSPVGVYDITLPAVADDNYSMSFQNGILTVTKAPLVIEANSLEKVYGDKNPELTLTYSGFKLSDTAKYLTTQPIVATTATRESSVGEYAITVAGALSPNYDITYKDGTLKITKATLEARIGDETVEYGDDPKFEIIYSGFKLDDDNSVVDIAPRVITTVTKESYPGTYEVHIEGGLDNNYTLHSNSSTHYITVVKAPLYVTIGDIKRAYQYPNPDFTQYMVFEGLKNDDTKEDLYTLPVATCSATQDSWYGEYEIVISGGYDPRYNFYLTNGTLYVVTESEAGIEEIVANSDGPITVYTINGYLISSNATEETLRQLSKGIYIVNGKKLMVR